MSTVMMAAPLCAHGWSCDKYRDKKRGRHDDDVEDPKVLKLARKRIDDLQDEVLMRKLKEAGLAETVVELKQSLEEAQERSESMVVKYREKKAELKELRQLLAEVTEKEKEAREEQENWSKWRESQGVEMEKMEDRVKVLESEKAELLQRVRLSEASKEKLENLKENKADLLEKVDRLKRELRLVKANRNEVEEELKELKIESKNSQANVVKMEEMLKEVEAKLQQKEERLESMQITCHVSDELSRKLKAAQIKNEELEEEYLDMEEQLVKLVKEQENDEMNKKLLDSRSALDSANQRIAELEAQLKEERVEKEQMEREYLEMEVKLVDSQPSLDSANQRIAELEARMKEELAVEERRFSSATTEIKTLNDNIASRDVVIHELHRKYVECDAERNRTEDATEELKTVHANFAEVNRENQVLRKHVAEVEGQYQALRDEMEKSKMTTTTTTADDHHGTQLATLIMANIITVVAVAYLAFQWGRSQGLLEERQANSVFGRRVGEREEDVVTSRMERMSFRQDVIEEMSTTTTTSLSALDDVEEAGNAFVDTVECVQEVQISRGSVEGSVSPMPILASISDLEDDGINPVCATESESEFEVIPQEEDPATDVETLASLNTSSVGLDSASLNTSTVGFDSANLNASSVGLASVSPIAGSERQEEDGDDFEALNLSLSGALSWNSQEEM